MISWRDLTPDQQSDYGEGVVELYGFTWDCYYKFVSEDLIEIYCEMDGYIGASYTHYKSLVSRKG